MTLEGSVITEKGLDAKQEWIRQLKKEALMTTGKKNIYIYLFIHLSSPPQGRRQKMLLSGFELKRSSITVVDHFYV
jgi:hypothetical protein